MRMLIEDFEIARFLTSTKMMISLKSFFVPAEY